MGSGLMCFVRAFAHNLNGMRSGEILRNLFYWLTALARKPPSTGMIWPVVKLECSEAR